MLKQILLPVFLLVFTLAPLHAATYPGKSYAEGNSAFNKGDYLQAKNNFERAIPGAPDNAVLHFKLGVAYYKLGSFEKAKDAFDKIINGDVTQNAEITSLSYYNLGLIAKQLSDDAEARRWFTAAYDNNNDKTRDLAAKQLQILDSQLTDLRWTVITLSARYDDNLIDPLLETGDSQGDSFGELFIASGGPLTNNSMEELQYDVNIYLNSHSHLDIYDFGLLHLGLMQPFMNGKWTSNAGFQLELSTFGGDPYQRSYAFDINTKYKANKKTAYGAQYIYRFIHSLNNDYDFLEGVQQQFIANVQWQNTGKSIARYTYEVNDLDDLADGITFTSFSPQRHGIDLLHERPVTQGLILNAGLGYRYSRYPDASTFIDGSRINRSDDRIMLSMNLMFQLASNWHLSLEYQYTDNDSNISDYAYTSNLYSLGVIGIF